MTEFFKGWRRKAGCVLLSMACLVGMVWMRSYGRDDSVFFYFRSSTHAIRSHAGRFCWTRMKHNVSASWLTWKSEEASDWTTVEFTRPSYLGFAFESYLMSINIDEGKVYFRRHFWVVPFWNIVLLFSVPAAFLILWPSQKLNRR